MFVKKNKFVKKKQIIGIGCSNFDSEVDYVI